MLKGGDVVMPLAISLRELAAGHHVSLREAVVYLAISLRELAAGHHVSLREAVVYMVRPEGFNAPCNGPDIADERPAAY